MCQINIVKSNCTSQYEEEFYIILRNKEKAQYKEKYKTTHWGNGAVDLTALGSRGVTLRHPEHHRACVVCHLGRYFLEQSQLFSTGMLTAFLKDSRAAELDSGTASRWACLSKSDQSDY